MLTVGDCRLHDTNRFIKKSADFHTVHVHVKLGDRPPAMSRAREAGTARLPAGEFARSATRTNDGSGMPLGKGQREGNRQYWPVGDVLHEPGKHEQPEATRHPVLPSELLRRAGAGDSQALNDLFAHYRDRLRWMVRLRLNRRLQGRVDPSDVIQEAYLEISKNLPDYLRDPKMPFFLWLRYITGQKLITLHRRYLGAQMCDAEQESFSLPRRFTAGGIDPRLEILDRLARPQLLCDGTRIKAILA